MKVVIAYESKYGNGKKCVELLRNILVQKGHQVESHTTREIDGSNPPQADLYVFSSPTHGGKPVRAMRKLLDKFQPLQKGARFALMATFWRKESAESNLHDTLVIMDEILRQKGMVKVGELPIFVRGMKGPLEDGYESKVEDFAERIMRS